MAGSDSTLVVTEDGDFAVCVVVSLDLLLDRTSSLQVFEEPRHGVGGVVCTEDLSSETSHVTRQVLVQCRCLETLD